MTSRRPADYRADVDPAAASLHPSQRPSFSAGNRAARAAWGLARLLLFRWTPRPLHAWRALVLTCFGARLGRGCHIYPGARIWAPWKLLCEDYVAIGDGAEVYNPAGATLGRRAILSQDSYLCGATHDYNDPDFPLVAYAMTVGPKAWLCARSVVAPGVQVGEGAVLGISSVATRDLEPWGVYAGSPATLVRERVPFTDRDESPYQPAQ